MAPIDNNEMIKFNELQERNNSIDYYVLKNQIRLTNKIN